MPLPVAVHERIDRAKFMNDRIALAVRHLVVVAFDPSARAHDGGVVVEYIDRYLHDLLRIVR